MNQICGVPGYKYYQKCCILDVDSSFSMLIDNYVCIMKRACQMHYWSLPCHLCHLSITCLLKDTLYMISALDSKLRIYGQPYVVPIPEMIPNEVSKDISLLPIQTYDMEAKTVVHHSDTVSVIVSCSMKPVVVDHEGLIRLSNILTSVEERLLALVTGCLHTISPLPQILIPNHNSLQS